MSGVFEDYAEVYASLYSDKNYRQEASYLATLFNQHSRRDTSSIIEFGAGNGQLSLELRRFGYSVTPLDLSPDMASNAVPGAGVGVGDIRTFQSIERVDGILAFFHVLSYLRSNDDLTQAFRTISRLLLPGGVFIADFWFAPAVRELKPEIRVKKVTDGDYEVFRVAEPEWDDQASCVEVTFTGFFRRTNESNYRKFEEKHIMRYFEEGELRRAASAEGVDLVHIEETITGRRASEKTWGVTAVFRKS